MLYLPKISATPSRANLLIAEAIHKNRRYIMSIFDYPFDSGAILKKKRSLKRLLLNRTGLLEKRIALLGGSTIGDIADVLEVFLLSFGIKPLFYIGRYNRFYEDVMFENQELSNFMPELIFIHTSAYNLADKDIMQKLNAVWAKIKADYACPIIQNNFELPQYGASVDNQHVNGLNVQLADYAKIDRDFYVNDIQYLSACLGLDEWFSRQDYYLYKYAVSIQAIPLLCHNVAKIIKSLYGKSQKCLVLDLDNTLWGGVYGDVGMGGVELGMETALGEAYVDFQKYVKTLYDKGAILAVCSKNDEQVAKEAFSHPNMVLQLEDFSVFCADWNNKAENVLKIAEQLNILPESMVFLDDNPAERELVRQALPEVKVPEVGSITDFIQHIEGAGYFYSASISDDDRKRNEYYAADAKRNEAKKFHVDYGEYLRSLQMTSAIQPFDAVHLDRITQLINKTNQFNLTTKRYGKSEIDEIMADSNYIGLYATLDDKFGSNGIVSVIIGEITQQILHIRLWVMSCRVFKRDLEYAVFDRLVEICRGKGLERIIGYYYKTEKNGCVEGLFDTLGFTATSSNSWELDVAADRPHKNQYIQIRWG